MIDCRRVSSTPAFSSSPKKCQVVLATKVVRTSAPCASPCFANEGLPSGNQTWLKNWKIIHLIIDHPPSFKPPLSFEDFRACHVNNYRRVSRVIFCLMTAMILVDPLDGMGLPIVFRAMWQGGILAQKPCGSSQNSAGGRCWQLPRWTHRCLVHKA